MPRDFLHLPLTILSLRAGVAIPRAPHYCPSMAIATGTSLIENPPEHSLGPAMLACTEDERRFVLALCEVGGNWTHAAALAGYGAARHAATRLKSRKRVLVAIQEQAAEMMSADAILSASALREIVSDPMNKQRFQAAVKLLEYAGLIVETQHRVIVEDERRDTATLLRDIGAAMKTLSPAEAKLLGLDPKEFLGQNAVVDAEYVEVDDFTILPGEFSNDAANLEDHGGPPEQALRDGEDRTGSVREPLAAGGDGG